MRYALTLVRRFDLVFKHRKYKRTESSFLSALFETMYSSEKDVFVSEVFANIRLMKRDNVSRLQLSRVDSRSSCHAKAQRCVIHCIYHHSLMLRSVFADSTNVGLENMVAVQVRHLTIRLHPDSILCVFRDNVE